jgi:hypothetical protein
MPSSEDDNDTEGEDEAQCGSLSLSRAIQEAKEVQGILLLATNNITGGLVETEHIASALAEEFEVRLARPP